MLKPSDFNNAVPQFSNGNYASNPINPQYVEEPSSTDYNRGTEPLQTLPAQWWNWFMNKFTSRFNKVNIYVKNLFNELAQLLSLVNVTPDGTESAVTDGQLKNAFKELYPDYINTKLALESTYVKKTQKVNNHALSGDVTVTKSDVGLGNVPNVSTNDQTPTYTEASSLTALSSGEKLSIAFGKLAKAVSSLISHIANDSNPHSVTKAQVGLGSVVNTGDSATPVENGTTKFTTGGAYTLKKDLTDIAESLPTDAVLHYSFDEVPDYPDGTADVRLIDNNTYQIQSMSQKFNSNGGTTFTNNNGYLQITIATAGSSQGAYIPNTYIKNKVIKLKIKVLSLTGPFSIHNGLGNTIKSITSAGTYEIVCMGTDSTANYNNLYIISNYIFDLIVEAIYIGDGSYTTPIIDNANGQWNSTSQSGVAVQGVSGKAIQCFNGNGVNIGNFNFNTDFAISLWVNPNDVANESKTIIIKEHVFAFYNGTQNDNVIQYVLVQNGTAVSQNFSTRLPANKYTHLVLSKSGTTIKAYVDGTLANTKTLTTSVIDQNSNVLYLGRTDNFGAVKSKFDDLLIFDRALTEDEVIALYLNKANTPKFYDINNYILDNTDSTPTQNSTNLVTSGGVYTELAKKANTTYVDTELAKKVDKTTTVNGHALSGNVTVTKGDVDLGNVVNTGDSATPISGGTTKFTTGGAYTELNKKLDKTSAGDQVTYSLSGNTLTITSLA